MNVKLVVNTDFMKPKIVKYLIALLHDAKAIRALAVKNNSSIVLSVIREAITFLKRAIHDYRLSFIDPKHKDFMKLNDAYNETYLGLGKVNQASFLSWENGLLEKPLDWPGFAPANEEW